MLLRFAPDVDKRLYSELTKLAAKCFYGNGPPHARVALPLEPFDLDKPFDLQATRRVENYQFIGLYRGKMHVGFRVVKAV